MAKYAKNIVEQAKSWLGYNETDGAHKQIIDVYNNHKPLARSYVVKYTDAWCATFVSACAIKCGYTDIIPTECSCLQMIQLFKNLGEWVENDAYVPNIGDVIFYDWQDSGSGDNTGTPDHVGIVESVSGSTITVIEGNKNNAVARRTIQVNGKYIRGYGVPNYDVESVATNELTSANDITWELNHSYFPILEIDNFVKVLDEAKKANSPLYWGYYKLVNKIK